MTPASARLVAEARAVLAAMRAVIERAKERRS
jgi:hypothetical protein